MIAGAALDNRQRILDATDLVALVGEHLALIAKGREYVGVCPFHDDHRPSMYVVPHKQIFHCFSCGAGGNSIDFLMKLYGLSFPEALARLAERAGIELQRGVPRPAAAGQAAPAAADKAAILAANQLALRLFRSLLSSARHGAAARAVLEQRGVSSDMAEAFALGAAPDRWDGLLTYAAGKGVTPAVLEAAGLAKPRSGGGGHYDVFRNRLIFPIFDQLGRPIAFGGRRLDDAEEPKYLNSPETILFDKSSSLYALKQAALPIKQARCAIVCEGYMDAIACHQAGVTNAVATLGTALTIAHAKLLRRLCDSIVLLFDGDDAGQNAAERAVEVCLAEPVDVRVAVLPPGVDPDDLLKSEHGRSRFDALIAAAVDALEFRYARLATRLDARGAALGSAARTAAVEEDLARIAPQRGAALSPVRRQAIIGRLARIAGVDEHAIAAAWRQAERKSRSRRPGVATGAGSDEAAAEPEPCSPALKQALGCLLTDFTVCAADDSGCRAVMVAAEIAGGNVARIAAALQEQTGAESRGLAQALANLQAAADRALATQLAQTADRQTEREQLGEHWHSRLREHWRGCLARLRKDMQLPAPAQPAETDKCPRAERLAEIAAITSAFRRGGPEDAAGPPEPADAHPPTEEATL